MDQHLVFETGINLSTLLLVAKTNGNKGYTLLDTSPGYYNFTKTFVTLIINLVKV